MCKQPARGESTKRQAYTNVRDSLFNGLLLPDQFLNRTLATAIPSQRLDLDRLEP